MAPSHSKRPIELVDLTQDENTSPTRPSAPKTARTSFTQPTRGHFSVNEREEISSSTQDDEMIQVDDNEFDDNVYQSLCLYGVLPTKVVGVRYYNGRATMGEVIILRREPQNPYDSNAIQVKNVRHEQVGHIPRTVASRLATFLDSGDLYVEGQLTGPRGEFDIPLSLKLFGTSDVQRQEALKERMKQARLPLKELNDLRKEEKKAAARKLEAKKREEERRRIRNAADAANRASIQTGGGTQFEEASSSQGFANLHPIEPSQTGPSLDDIIDSSVAFDPRELGEVVDKYGTSEETLSQLPASEQPYGIATKLLPYQLQGLYWMHMKEMPLIPPPDSKDSIQLWKRSPGGFTNIATNYSINGAPSLASGGVLSDDMGLGKTLQTISLIVADPTRDSKKPTLIVSPLSVMSNWSGQIESHVQKDKPLRVYTYHGSNKKIQKPSEFQEYDVVITTYETLSAEYFNGSAKPSPLPRSRGLYSVDWRRTILDEAHFIRNPKAKRAVAAYAISSKSQSKWALTGTPIVNNLRDLQSYVKFIGFTGGLEHPEVFASTLIRPLNQGRPEATLLLQALVGTMCLRRAKDMKFIDLRLPELSSHKYTVAWHPEERKTYEAFQSEAQGLLTKVLSRKNKKGENTYSHLLEVLLRLRQACNHTKLCGEDRVTNLLAALEEGQTVDLNTENKKALQDLLQQKIEMQEECPICLSALHSPCITTCAHTFGKECIERSIELDSRCPLCRAELTDQKSLVEPAQNLGESGRFTEVDLQTSSSKVEALLSILRASRKTGVKTIVFSQWTSFLDIVQNKIVDENFSFTRLDGKMNNFQRDEAIHRLDHDDTCTVMLASLGVCGVGLNLCSASQVVLSDSWWSGQIEDQAVDRVYRLGQKKPVNVFRLVMEDSIEDRVIQIQQEKRKLAMAAFNEKTMKRGNEKTTRLADIEKLLR